MSVTRAHQTDTDLRSPCAHLAPIARLPSARVRLQLALHDIGKLLWPALETRQFHLGCRGRIGWPIAGVARSLGWAGLRHGVVCFGDRQVPVYLSAMLCRANSGRRGVGGDAPFNCRYCDGTAHDANAWETWETAGASGWSAGSRIRVAGRVLPMADGWEKWRLPRPQIQMFRGGTLALLPREAANWVHRVQNVGFPGLAQQTAPPRAKSGQVPIILSAPYLHCNVGDPSWKLPSRWVAARYQGECSAVNRCLDSGCRSEKSLLGWTSASSRIPLPLAGFLFAMWPSILASHLIQPADRMTGFAS